MQERWNKKSVVSLSCRDIQQALEDCIDKALDSLKYRNTGLNPTMKEGKVTKIRKKM